MVDAGRAGAQTGWRDLFVAGLSLYPIAVDAGLKYWAELAASASSYHADVIQGGLAVLARPQCLGAVLDDLAGQFRQHLERWGESAERTMLEFNQRLEVALRSPAAHSAAPAPQDDRQVAE